jgi:hypothetical protein
MLRRSRMWALLVWTGTAISTGVVARLTFAAPQPEEWTALAYVFIGLLWLAGLAVIVVVGEVVGYVVARRRRRSAPAPVRPQRRWLRGVVIAASVGCIALPFGVWGLTAVGSHRRSSPCSNAPPRVATTRVARLVLPRVVQRLSFIPLSSFDPGYADRVARRARYAAWVVLGNEHTADVAVWASRPAAVQAVRLYRKGGPDTRPGGKPPVSGRVARVDRLENVTVAWYTRPTRGDTAAFKRALLVPHGGAQYTRLWTIPGALMESTALGGTGDASVEASIVQDHCDRHFCALFKYVEVAIWPSAAAAQSYCDESKDVLDQGPFERIKNATISWTYHPTSAARAAVMSALH